jgi:predicted HTH domain antitoxin
MHTLTIEIPEQCQKEKVLLSIAGQLYTKKLLSLSQAANLAGVTLDKFILSELPEGDPLRQWISEDDGLTTEEIVQKQIKQRGYKGAK